MPELTLEGMNYKMNGLEDRVNRNETRLDKMEADALRTDVAVLKVEVAGLNKRDEIRSAEVALLNTKVTSTSSAWAGSKATVLLAIAVTGGLAALLGVILQAVGH